MVLQLSAQVKTITGTVKDPSGQPIPMATIKSNQKSVGFANASGQFNVSVPAAAKSITVSSVGFEDIQVNLTGGQLDIVMKPASTDINDVVVTGYTTIAKKKFSGASTVVSAAEVRKQTFGSFDQALQGSSPGVSVIANSGQPGANAVVRIRGNGSISGGNVPLYILDGIEINAADFATMNQGDFERVETLRDAMATAMYGSRGANGVIVITSRRGRSGQIQLNYDTQVGFSDIPKDRLIVMNSQQKIDYEIQRGNPNGWTTAELDSLRNVNFNWKNALFQTGMTQQHMISASGGNENAKVFASLAYFDQQGTVRTTGLKRYTARINADVNVKNWKFGLTLQSGFSKSVGTSENNSSIAAPLNATRWANPYERDIDPRTGDYQETGGAGSGQLSSGQNNPVMELYLRKNNTIQVKTIATTSIEYHFPFLKGLFARTNWGIDYSQNEGYGFASPRVSGAAGTQGAIARSLNRNMRYTGTTSLQYKTAIKKHDIEVGLYTEIVKRDQRNFGFTGFGLTNGFDNEAGITAGSSSNANFIPNVTGGGTQSGIQSFFSIINYGYDNKYFLALVARRDGSSRFGVNNRFANFGSVGFTWSMDQEQFMQGVKFVNDLKLRASIGVNGNNQTPSQVGDYPIPIFGRTSYGGTSGWAASTAGNLDYKWETNRTVNIGIDFAVWNRKISGSIELYDRKTNDLFFQRPIDFSLSGFGNVPSNFGSLRNRGLEVSLKGNIINSKNFRWTLEGNLTYNQNRVIDLPRDSVIGAVSILAKNKPLNSLYLVEYAGVDPSNGNALYRKRDKSVTTVYDVKDAVIHGTSDAPWFGAITTRFEYKGFDLSALMVFFLDREMYNNDRTNVTNPQYVLDNMHVEVLKEWRKPGDITNVPRPTAGTNNGTGIPAPLNPFIDATTRFLEDASFWRLRNVTLGYTFSNAVVQKLKIRSARVFIQGQNWWTATKFQSFDPEMVGLSLTGAQFPALVQTTVGLSVGF